MTPFGLVICLSVALARNPTNRNTANTSTESRMKLNRAFGAFGAGAWGVIAPLTLYAHFVSREVAVFVGIKLHDLVVHFGTLFGIL